MSLSDVIKKGSGAPAPSALVIGGLGIDTLNKRLYFKAADGAVVPHDLNTPAGSISATTVQGAINELDVEKADKVSLGLRNVLINGGFFLWQRATSQTAAGYGSADRWACGHIGGSKTASKQLFTLGQTDVPGNPISFMRHVVTAGSAVGDVCYVQQAIEGVQTLAGTTVTLSFWAKADSAKDISSELSQSFGVAGSPSAAVTAIGVTRHSLTTAWQRFTTTFAIPSISGKTLGTDAADSLRLRFYFSAGSNSDARTLSLGHQSGTFDIANAQLESGTVATPFESLTPGHIQSLCNRYYQAFGIKMSSYSLAGAVPKMSTTFLCPMQSAPTVVETEISQSNLPAPTTYTVTSTDIIMQRTATAAATSALAVTLTLDAEL